MTDQAKIKQLAEDIANTLTDSLVKSGLVRDTPVKTKPDFKINKEFNPFVTKTLKNHLGEEVFELLAFMDITLAGGAIVSILTNQKINDFDLYARSKEDAYILASILDRCPITNPVSEWFLDRYASSYVQELSTDKSIVFRDVNVVPVEMHLKGLDLPPLIQVMTFKFVDQLEDLFNSFDFTACMGAYSFKDEHLYLHENFLYDNLAKSLIFNPNTDYPFSSLLRVQKYIDKGFKISNPQMLRVAMTCARKGLSSWESIKEEISGMYGVDVDELFDETKDFSLDEVINQLGSLAKNLKGVCSEDKNRALMPLVLREVSGMPDKHIEWKELFKDNVMTVVKALSESRIETNTIVAKDYNQEFVVIISTDTPLNMKEGGKGVLSLLKESRGWRSLLNIVRKDLFLQNETYHNTWARRGSDLQMASSSSLNSSYAYLASMDEIKGLLASLGISEDRFDVAQNGRNGFVNGLFENSKLGEIEIDLNRTLSWHTDFPVGNSIGDRIIALSLNKSKQVAEEEKARKEAIQEKRDDEIEQLVAELPDVEFISQ